MSIIGDVSVMVVHDNHIAVSVLHPGKADRSGIGRFDRAVAGYQVHPFMHAAPTFAITAGKCCTGYRPGKHARSFTDNLSAAVDHLRQRSLHQRLSQPLFLHD
ncbi:hypothetical protein D3C81_1883900 [compost metagenome]